MRCIKQPEKDLPEELEIEGEEDYGDDDEEDEEEVEDEEAKTNGKKNDVPPISEAEALRRKELEQAPMQCELKHLERRWTAKGKGYLAEPKEDDDVPEQTVNWHEKFALCITRTFNNRNTCVVRTSLQVNSPAIKKVLSEVIGSKYPNISYLTHDIVVDFPAKSLFHYQHELKEATEKLEAGSDGARHMPLLLDFIAEQFQDEIRDGGNLLEQGLVSYHHLWTIFRPGSLVFATFQSQPRAFTLQSCEYQWGQCPSFQLNCTHVDYDGAKFGTLQECLSIPIFDGVMSIANLNALPFDMHPQADAVKDRLTRRGAKWESLAGQNFQQYRGVAIGNKCEGCFNIDGRVMVDCKTFHRINANRSFNVNPFAKTNEEKRQQHLKQSGMDLLPGDTDSLTPLTDQQKLLATPRLRGFSFDEKKFLDFFVDDFSDIDWNTQCFDQLVLPESQKELVQALVAEHTARATKPNTAAFDDIVKGKGRGLILVLHGPPGVGKTLTAECVAEFSRRPLYIVSSGDLGTSASTLDDKLSRALDLASTWKAVLLIDEADVFLERRSLHDMERNGLVSIFLRTLEYYSGILFMTTNRVRTFDDAFKSRIHVPLRYDNLPRESRLKVWKNFLAKIDGGVDIDDAGLETLAEGPLNGRQIKNIVRTAKSLATYKDKKLDCAQLQQVMQIQMAFEEELDAATNGDVDMIES